MTTSTWAFGRASQSNTLRLSKIAFKRYSTVTATNTAQNTSNGNGLPPTPVDSTTQRELFMNVLNANATKRDAKQYLARFKPPKTAPSNVSQLQNERNARLRQDQDRLDRIGVNLGGLYAPARAIAESPQFVRELTEEAAAVDQQRIIHVALVCLREPQLLDDATLDGVALTLSQLVKLDMKIAIVLDTADNDSLGWSELRGSKSTIIEQSERLAQALAKHSSAGARLVQGAIEAMGSSAHQKITVGLPNLLLEPLKRSVVPIVPTSAYTSQGQLVTVSASDVMSATSLMLSDLQVSDTAPGDSKVDLTSLDRIIVLDTLGGVPSKTRGDAAHLFINLEQEFEDIKAELDEYSESTKDHAGFTLTADNFHQHRSNLEMVQNCLSLLPSASSALIITPAEAASSSQTGDSATSTTGAGTRRQKNTLIHNLLTNKPTVSPSLPEARMSSIADVSEDYATMKDVPNSTLVKRGMPLTIIPGAPRGRGWQVPVTGETNLDLTTDPRVDLPRLVHLIDDSFRRKLSLQHYLNRIQNRIAGLIIAGSYEGGAILTWEQPPNTTSPDRLVPYLDKFAVLSSSQGSSGVADILFQAMVRTCFPKGVCWRSRKDNPVNKWYFERADGHWQIPGTNWTMFWTGEGVVEDELRWNDYCYVRGRIALTSHSSVHALRYRSTGSVHRIHPFLGLFDCVNSVGTLDVPFWGKTPPLPAVQGTAKFVRHAVAIDERRVKFKAALFAQEREESPDEDIKEVWFPGNHGDIGGGWSRDKAEGTTKDLNDDYFQMSDVALKWMIDEVDDVEKKCETQPERRLAWEPRRKVDFLKRFSQHKDEMRKAKMHDTMTRNGGAPTTGWFKVLFWNWMEYFPLIKRWEFVEDSSKKGGWKWDYILFPLNRGGRRDIPNTALFHHAVVNRMRDHPEYVPNNPMWVRKSRNFKRPVQSDDDISAKNLLDLANQYKIEGAKVNGFSKDTPVLVLEEQLSKGSVGVEGWMEAEKRDEWNNIYRVEFA